MNSRLIEYIYLGMYVCVDVTYVDLPYSFYSCFYTYFSCLCLYNKPLQHLEVLIRSLFLPRVKLSIVGSLRDREVACSASNR